MPKLLFREYKQRVLFDGNMTEKHIVNETYERIVDKLLANLGVIGDLEEGDKLWYTAEGNLIIQKPTWIATGMRTILRVNRWNQTDHIYKIVRQALKFLESSHSEQIENALARVQNGLKNLCKTYEGDSPIVNRIAVLSDHVSRALGKE